MIRCPICQGYGLVKKAQIKPQCNKIPKKDTYSSWSQYGLYKECDNCIGSGKIKKKN